jgi:hypothetical protein
VCVCVLTSTIHGEPFISFRLHVLALYSLCLHSPHV